MATLTSNISNRSVTVNGSNNTGVMISWTLPIVPAGGIVTARTLTGVATANMKKGSATIKVDGTTVRSDTLFTINFDINSDKTSVSTVVTGGNKNASGTVTFSNLVYTVTYTELAVTYTVTFVNWDGSVLKTEEVESGSAATAPNNPSREGYNFTGWDKAFSNITSDLTVTAQYNIKTYTVSFYSDSILLKTETVEHGKSATAPEIPTKEGYIFIGWNRDFTNVTSNLDISALYEVAINDTLQIKENGNWINIGKVYKRVSGNWVEQNNSNWNDIFNIDMKYVKLRFPNPTAILYEDGTFIFSNYDDVSTSHGSVTESYSGWDTDVYSTYNEVPWYNNRRLIKEVYIDNINTIATDYWFYTCSSLTSLSSFDTSNVTSMNHMFHGCHNLTVLDLSNFNTSNVISMNSMFNSCYNLTSLDLSSFDTSNVTSMNVMFNNCSNLTVLDLSNFNTSNVTSMNSMFYNCSSLTSLDLSSFNTSNVTSMSYMFSYCSSLISLDISNFDMTNVTNTNVMFNGCTNLQTIYVKDEIAKTKIESSSDLPTGVSVIIGRPN